MRGVAQAREAIASQKFDLAPVDLQLPDGSGYGLCRQIRAAGDTPVVLLTAFDDEVNVVMGLDMGADDYTAKPFRLRELMSRLRTVLHRAEKSQDSADVLQLGDDVQNDKADSRIEVPVLRSA